MQIKFVVIILSIALFFLFCFSCHPQPAHAPSDEVSRSVDQRWDRLLCTTEIPLPPQADTERFLMRLKNAAAQGSCCASWKYSQYMLDLFDWVRLVYRHTDRPSAQAEPVAGHQLLWKTLGLAGAPTHGLWATKQVLSRFNQQFPLNAKRCAEYRDFFSTAAKLLQADSAPRRKLKQALTVVTAYKEIARSTSPLALNAQLRLIDWCSQAFKLAVGASPRLQYPRINQCLFPLFDADPGPYFHQNAAERPPDPPWTLIAGVLKQNQRKLLKTRFHALAQHLTNKEEKFFLLAAPSLPSPLNLAQTLLPVSKVGEPWDRTPLVLLQKDHFLVGGQVIWANDEENLVTALQKQLRQDQRGRITIAADPKISSAKILTFARIARRAGASILDLGVARQVAEHASIGDVQLMVFQNQPILRLEVLPLWLELFSTKPLSPLSRREPRQVTSPSDLANNQLAFHFGGPTTDISLSSRDGTWSDIAPEQISQVIVDLRQAYPEDNTLNIIPEGNVNYGELITVINALRELAPQLMFPRLGIAPGGPFLPPTKDLSPLVHILSRATVELQPPISPIGLASFRHCYLRTLRQAYDHPKKIMPQGTLVIRQRGHQMPVLSGKLRSMDLRRCVKSTWGSLPEVEPQTYTIHFAIKDG